MAALAHVFGVPTPHLSTDLEHVRLNTGTFLDLHEKSVCTGITADVLQNFSSLPDGTGSQQYFRYILNLPANVMFFHMCSIMSNSCQLLLPTTQDKHNMSCIMSNSCQLLLPTTQDKHNMSCIMSNSCQLLLPTTQDKHNMCSNCSHVEKTINARYQKQKQKSLQHETIKSNDPLHSVTGHQMKEVFYDTFLECLLRFLVY